MLRLLCTVLAAVALLNSTAIAHGQKWDWYTVKKGDTVKSVADSIGVSQQTLREWNPRLNEVPYLLKGQSIVASDPGPNAPWPWSFHRNSPACLPYAEQLDEIERSGRVPAEVCRQARVSADAGLASKDRVGRGHHHAAAFFCDKNGNPVVKGETITMWVDEKGRPIPSLEVAKLPSIDYLGVRWTPYQYEGCRNAAFDSLHIALPEPPSPPPVVERVPEPVPNPAPPDVTFRPAPARPDDNPNIVDHWTFWDKTVYGRPEGGHDFWENFPGLEGIILLNRAQTIGVDIYAAGGFLGGEDHPFDGDPSINTRLGIQGVVYDNPENETKVRLEGGGYFDAWRKTMGWPVKVSANLQDVGFYGRLIATGPSVTSAEVVYRQGDKLIFDKRLTLVAEPGQLYAKLGTGIWKYPALHDRVDGTEVTFPAERNTITQVRAGFKPVRRLVLYASYDNWSYIGEGRWDQLMNGPGVGLEYRAPHNLTFMGEAIAFRNHWHDVDRELRGDPNNRGTSKAPRFGFQLQWGF